MHGWVWLKIIARGLLISRFPHVAIVASISCMSVWTFIFILNDCHLPLYVKHGNSEPSVCGAVNGQ